MVTRHMSVGKEIAKAEVDTRKFGWSEVYHVQLLVWRTASKGNSISRATNTLLVSLCASHRPVMAKGLEDDDVAQSAPGDKKVDNSIWPPSKPMSNETLEPE